MVNIGLSDDHDVDGEVVHLTDEGVLGGATPSGARIDCVSDSTAGSTLEGMIKCIASSL
jgi:hypothetical protein